MSVTLPRVGALESRRNEQMSPVCESRVSTFGVALAMAITPSKHVSSGFYRVHLWVLMGLNTFAALAVFSQTEALADVLKEIAGKLD